MKMRFLRFALTIVVISLSTMAFAQSVAQSDAQKSFDKMKTLAGSWEGRVVGTGTPMDGTQLRVTLRVTSRGNALVHEMTQSASPDDPITMFYLDGDRLLLTHYCDAGNRPRMTGKLAPDGKSVDFEFLDVAGNTQYGHMHHAIFTVIDANHHAEEWTFMQGDKPVQARVELQRVK
jgi:hypothetical protein